MASLAALLVAVAAPQLAQADVAPPPDDDDDVVSYCDPDQEEGDACTTYDGDEGTCDEETALCWDSTNEQEASCHVCEGDCSIAAVGAQRSAPSGGLAVGLGLALGMLLLRRRRR